MEEEDTRLKLKKKREFNGGQFIENKNKKICEKESSILCYNYYICKLEELQQQQHTKKQNMEDFCSVRDTKTTLGNYIIFRLKNSTCKYFLYH